MMRERWNALAPRERNLLLTAAAVVGAALFYLVVWEPLQKSNHRLQGDVDHLRSTLTWLRSVEPEVLSLRGRSNTTNADGSVLSQIDQSSKQAGLAAQITRMQPEGEKEVRVWFDRVSFDALLRWVLNQETTQGLLVKEMQLSRTDQAGMVSARLTLRRP